MLCCSRAWQLSVFRAGSAAAAAACCSRLLVHPPALLPVPFLNPPSTHPLPLQPHHCLHRGRHVRIGGRAWSDSDRTVSPSPRHPEGSSGGSGRSPRFGDQYYGEHEGDDEEEEDGSECWGWLGAACILAEDSLAAALCCTTVLSPPSVRPQQAALLPPELLLLPAHPCCRQEERTFHAPSLFLGGAPFTPFHCLLLCCHERCQHAHGHPALICCRCRPAAAGEAAAVQGGAQAALQHARAAGAVSAGLVCVRAARCTQKFAEAAAGAKAPLGSWVPWMAWWLLLVLAGWCVHRLQCG